jgi:hypothetical protein
MAEWQAMQVPEVVKCDEVCPPATPATKRIKMSLAVIARSSMGLVSVQAQDLLPPWPERRARSASFCKRKTKQEIQAINTVMCEKAW